MNVNNVLKIKYLFFVSLKIFEFVLLKSICIFSFYVSEQYFFYAIYVFGVKNYYNKRLEFVRDVTALHDM